MFGKTIPITDKALKCLPNTFSECDEKVARLEKEIKSLKAQIEDFKGIKEEHRKRPHSARHFGKKIFENFLSKIKQDIFKSQIIRHDFKYTFFFR